MKNRKLPDNPRAGRNARGAGVVVLVFLLAFFVIGVVGVFAFEVTRNNSCRDELRSSCEAAALAAAAALASSNYTSASTSHDNAEKAAQQAFVSNSVVGTLLSDVNWFDSRGPAGSPGNGNQQGGNPSASGGGGLTAQQVLASQPPAGFVNFYIEFLTPTGAQSQWSQSDGRIAHVVAVFGEEPAFAKYAGLTAVAVTSQARAQVPQMDIMMCFDVSSSIDDQSKVTFVKRWMNGGSISYSIATSTAGTPAEGTLYGILQPVPTGTSVNVEYPQALSYASLGTNGQRLTFNPGLRSSGADVGAPPGGGSGGPNDFTDLVANLDGNNHFTSFTYTDP
ncbi:MAG TPA: pilus assembly protein TadG-related protein, partial [Candidatus Obscuribacterales bacterium]